MNRIQRNKLKLSKWTAVVPQNKEKHFMVTRVLEEEGQALQVVLEAIHSKQEYVYQWDVLKDDAIWKQGWK